MSWKNVNIEIHPYSLVPVNPTVKPLAGRPRPVTLLQKFFIAFVFDQPFVATLSDCF